jgi:HD-GYP domain-containing protein (c-di-GMP phosphodiesterase class II)
MIPSIGELVNLLTVGINHSAIYFRGHPRVLESAADFSRRLEETLAQGDEHSLFLGVVDGRLVCEGKPLLGPTLIAKRLIDAAGRLQAGGFLFQRGTTSDELRELFGLLGEQKQDLASLEEARRLLTSRGVTHVVLSPKYGQPGWLGDMLALPGGFAAAGGSEADAEEATVGGAGFRASIGLYHELRSTVETAHAAVETGHDVDVNGARTEAESLAASVLQNPTHLFGHALSLSQVPDYASYTLGHTLNVALLAVLVGNRMGLRSDLVMQLGTAGLLHDVGKGKIPHEILYKRGVLDPEERKVMNQHPVLGAQALLQSREAEPLSIAAAFGHHVRHDQKGYPKVGPWYRPNRLISLLQICDVFEALTAVRPYKPSLTPRRAYEIMLKDPGAYDPVAFRAFVRAVGFFPPARRVLLDSGEQALVLCAGAHPAKPVVEVLRDPSGNPLPRAERPVLDLSAPDAKTRVEEILPHGFDRTEEVLRVREAATAPAQPPHAEAVPHAHDHGC